MNQGTQGDSLTKKTEGRKSSDTVSLTEPRTGSALTLVLQIKFTAHNWISLTDFYQKRFKQI
jgi:hypothetical protein